MRNKNIWILLAMIFMILSMAGCGKSERNKEEAKVREVAQKYFDALKAGDQEGVYDCYLPIERQRRDAETGILGFAGRLILGLDLTQVLSDWNVLYGGESVFTNYKYRVSDVMLDEEGEEATAYVNVYEEKELLGSLRIDMTKYDGNWYVIKDSIADDDRNIYETEEAGENSSDNEAVYESEAADTENGKKDQMGVPVLIVAISVISATVAVFFLFFIRSRILRKQMGTEFPFTSPSGSTAEMGEIMCSCGTVNPIGVRSCMGCGKKLKRRR